MRNPDRCYIYEGEEHHTHGCDHVPSEDYLTLGSVFAGLGVLIFWLGIVAIFLFGLWSLKLAVFHA